MEFAYYRFSFFMDLIRNSAKIRKYWFEMYSWITSCFYFPNISYPSNFVLGTPQKLWESSTDSITMIEMYSRVVEQRDIRSDNWACGNSYGDYYWG
jgi:hypothetical protein